MSDDDSRDELVEDPTAAHIPAAHTVEDDNSAAEMPDLDDPQKTPPAVHDGQSFSGSNAALTSDDDIDELGEEYGVHYEENEELEVQKKIDIATRSLKPEPESTES